MVTALNKKIIFSIGILCTIALSILSLSKILYDEQQFKRDNIEPYRIQLHGYYSVDSQPNTYPLPKNYKFDIGSGHSITVLGNFDKDIPEDQLIIMQIVNLQVDMFMNDQLIYSFGSPGTMPPYAKSGGNLWDSFVSPGISASDDIRLELTSLYSYHGDTSFTTFLENLYYGYEKEIIRHNLSTHLQGPFLSSLIVFMGIAAIIFAHVLRTMKKSPFEALALAGLSIFGGIWFFIDFSTQDYFMPYPVFNNSLDVLTMMITLIFLLIYTHFSLKSKGRLAILGGAVIFMLLIVASTAAQFTHMLDYYDFVPVIIELTVFFTMLIIALLAYEWRCLHNRKAKSLIFSMSLIFAGEILDMILTGLGLEPTVSGFKLGILLFIMVQIIRIALYIQRENMWVQIIEKQREYFKKALAYQKLITEATKGLYENIYEVDITNNCAGSADTRRHFLDLGVAAEASFDETLQHIAENQIKEEFKQEYISLFSRQNVLDAYEKGVEGFSYEFMTSTDGRKSYYWMRVTARIFFWNDDQSVRMLTYRQNINEEKTRELMLTLKAKLDLLSGLYNKTATEQMIDEILSERQPGEMFALFLLDIDKFKTVNDTHGHAFGDEVIKKFSAVLKSQFRSDDIVGRIGGDEFAAFIKITRKDALNEKGERLARILDMIVKFDGQSYNVSSSIGIALSPEAGTNFNSLYKNADLALYHTKEHGRNGYSIFTGI